MPTESAGKLYHYPEIIQARIALPDFRTRLRSFQGGKRERLGRRGNSWTNSDIGIISLTDMARSHYSLIGCVLAGTTPLAADGVTKHFGLTSGGSES